MTPPLPDANKKSPRVYRNLQTKDLENVTFSDMEATGDPLSIELHNEDELRRLVLVQLARLTTKSEWTGLLTSGGGGGMSSFDLDADTGTAETVTNGDTVKLVGGTAIGTAVTSPDTVTITNTGVTSLVAGSNITLSGSTGAVTITASGGGGSSTGYQAVLTDTQASSFPSNRQLHLVSCLPPWGNTNSGSTGSTTVSDNPYFRPFISPVTGTVTEIQVNCNDASSNTKYDIGIYSDTNGFPDSKIAEAEVVTTATGTLAVTTFTGTPALTAGTQYHFAWVRKDASSGSGNFTAENASNMFKFSPVSQTYPNLTSVGNTGAVMALSSSSNTLPATVTTSNLNPFSNNPIRFGMRWD